VTFSRSSARPTSDEPESVASSSGGSSRDNTPQPGSKRGATEASESVSGVALSGLDDLSLNDVSVLEFINLLKLHNTHGHGNDTLVRDGTGMGRLSKDESWRLTRGPIEPFGHGDECEGGSKYERGRGPSPASKSTVASQGKGAGPGAGAGTAGGGHELSTLGNTLSTRRITALEQGTCLSPPVSDKAAHAGPACARTV
jgi:hypothetical protein